MASSEALLTRHEVDGRPRWAYGGALLASGIQLGDLLELPASSLRQGVESLAVGARAPETLAAPIDPDHEVWAAGVTYSKSRAAREAESRSAGGADVYARVYDAPRPELFLKAVGRRVVGPGSAIRARRDSSWTVPEPEMVLVLNRDLEIVGYCAGNDVSARDIEGANPLYLPQAKVYEGSCALGPALVLAEPDQVAALEVALSIRRDGELVFESATKTSEMRRTPVELTEYLGSELGFARGVFLMTGTSIVPPDDYTLHAGDDITVRVGSLELRNTVGGTT